MSIHANRVGGHDRGTAAAGRDTRVATVSSIDAAGSNGQESPPAVLRSALEQLRVEGAIFLRSEFTESWAYESPPVAMAGMLHPGAERLIFFHIVARGSCWISVADGERHWAGHGDVIVLPYGDQHTVGGEAPAECVSILTLLDPPPWEVMPVIRHGGGGARTDIVCGYLHSEDPSIAYSLEETAPSNASPSLISTRLPELVLIEVLRLHLATAPATDRGWIAALRDPVLAPALSLLHSSPELRWTVADLASGAAVSRSLLDERFRQVLGRSPIRYLTEWRMHLAEELLATTDMGVVMVARRVGYDSEEAFSRAFKRARGLSPSHWRAARSAPSAATVRQAATPHA